MIINPFQHGFTNDAHLTREALTPGHYMVVSCGRELVRIKGSNTSRWCVEVTLYGPKWTDKDIARAERNRRYLAAGTTQQQALEVRQYLARTDFGFSLELKPQA